MGSTKNVKVMGVRRLEAGGKVQYLSNGGWISWGVLSPYVQSQVLYHPDVIPYTSGPYDFQLEPFTVQWGGIQQTPPPPAQPVGIDEAFEQALAEDQQWLDELVDENVSDGNEPDDGDAESGASAQGDNPTDGDSASDGGSGGGSSDDDIVFYVHSEGFELLQGGPVVGEMIAKAVDAEATVTAGLLTQMDKDLRQYSRETSDAAFQTVPGLIAEALVAHTTDMVEYVDTSVNTLSDTLSTQMAEIAAQAAAASGAPRTIYVQVGHNIGTPTTGTFHKSFDDLVRIAATGQHIYLPGVPGGGKSHSAEQAADVLSWRFGSLSLSPMTPDSRIWGGKDANGNFHEPTFIELARHAAENPDNGSIFVLDEMDNGNGGIIASMNSAMANGWFTAPNGDVINFSKNRNFVVIGCANTYGTGPTAEFAGRNKLDPATLDRFVYLPWETDLAMERALVGELLEPNIARDWLNVWQAARENVETHGLKTFVTMRGALAGARLINAGYSGEKAFMFVLGNKMAPDQLAKVNPF